MDKIKTYAPWVLVLIAFCAAIWAWYNPKVEYVPDGTVIKVTDTHVKYVKQHIITTPECTVEVIKDEQVEGNPVTAKAEIKTDNTDYAVVTTITPSTGKTEIFITPEKSNLFSFRNDKEIGIRYGVNEYELYGRWTFFRVGVFHIAAYGYGSTNSHANLMLELSYRW